MYLFRAVERQAQGQPALLICDEAWVMLGHELFREKVRDWLKTARKANTAILLATQSLSDATGSGLVDVLNENTATKKFLANGKAEQDDSAALYRALGLIDAEITAIRRMTPKREYFVVSEEGRRVIDFAIGPLALAFVGASGRADVQRIRKLGALVLAAAVWSAPASAQFGLAGVAKEWTQLANNAQLVHIASQEVRQLATQIQQYQQMVRQGLPLNPWQVRDIMGDLQRVSQIVSMGSDVARGAADFDQLLRAAYPGYDYYADGYGGTYADEYRHWNTRRMDAVRDAYYAADLHAVQFRDEDAAAREIERQMQTATGQMQVLQASGAIARMEVEQMQKLRQLLTVQIKMQGEVIAAEADRQAAEDASLEEEREAIRAALADTEARRALIETEGVMAGRRMGRNY